MRGDLAEGFGEARLQGCVKLFVDGDAHFFELGGVIFVEFRQAVFDGEAEFFLLVGGLAGDFVEAAVQGFAGFDEAAIDFADEVRQTLGDGVEILLNCGAESFVGGFVVGAEGVEAGVEEIAEFGDVIGDLGAEVGEVGGSRFAGAASLCGGVGAELG